jgi:T4 RnlA family RNA ligase
MTIHTKYETFLNENKGSSNFIPTYEQAVEMCERNPKIFYEAQREIAGYPVSIFNYRLASWTHFTEPVPGKDWNAKELRGLTFIFEKDGKTLYRRYLHLQKFWNVNQTEETLYDNIKDLKIKSIHNKEDGSLATFVELPNGKIVAKTKGAFDSEQAEVIQRIYEENSNIRNLVDFCLKDNDIIPLFEYVSWQNKIVLNYGEDQLILLRLRDNKTGHYLSFDEFQTRFDLKKIALAPNETGYSLDELLDMAKTVKDKEGWVIEFEGKNGQPGLMAKVKTDWYFQKHRLTFDLLNQENNIINIILDENMDDAISQLDPKSDKEKIEYIREIEELIEKYIVEKLQELEEAAQEFEQEFGGKIGGKDWENAVPIKRFAIAHSKEKEFGLKMAVVRGKAPYQTIVDSLKKRTNRLEQTRQFLEQLRKQYTT